MASNASTPTVVELKIRRRDNGGIRGKFVRPFWKNDQEVDFEGENLLVSFNIVDDGGTGLVFPDQASRALWVQPVSDDKAPCPPPGSSWSGFQPTGVSNNNLTLDVSNPNQAKQLFKFSMNFTRNPADPNSELECWDPIGNNKNGQNRAISPSTAAAVALAIVTGLAALAASVRTKRAKSR